MVECWFDARVDLPENGEKVLAVKELKNGRRELCFASCIREYERYDYVRKETVKGPYWTTGGGNNNVVFWRPLPEIPTWKGEF